MSLTKPKALKQGDTIGLISPASSPNDLTRIDKALHYLEMLGYKVKLGNNIGKYFQYLAGTDEERLDDIHKMFSDDEVKAIICLRGGYGSPRLLDRIDYKLIKKNPKIFVGYSDITALQMAFLHKSNLITFAGPMAAVDLYQDVNRYTEENFWRAVTSKKKAGTITPPQNQPLSFLTKGKAEGRIIGGNLALFVSILGTPYFPDYKNCILFLEDTGEAPYRVDRLLNQLKLAGVLDELSGIILGQFTDCVDASPDTKTFSLDEIFRQYFGKLLIPVVTNFPAGHIKEIMTIPFGTQVKLNSRRETIEFTENGVE